MPPKLLNYDQALQLQKSDSKVGLLSNLDSYIDELFDIEYPYKKDTKTEAEVAIYRDEMVANKPNEWGAWAYYPWLNLCLQVPPKKELRMLRTSRNRNLITIDEQEQLYSKTILIAGMSVGSNVVEAMVSQGIGGKFILADMDIIETSNLNRIRSPLHHIGLHKVEAISRKLWEIDPYLEVVALNDGISKPILEDVFTKHTINIVVDEMDNLEMKIAIREKAKAEKMPVIMAADDGDDALIDVERYDLNPDMELFSGLVPPEIIDRIKQGGIARKELGMLIGKYFVGAEHTPLRMFESLAEVGKTLPSWPQLGGAAALSGISLAYIAKKIILGQNVTEGRTLISLDEKLTKVTEDDQEKLEKFRQMTAG